jgi:hypothetical protein
MRSQFGGASAAYRWLTHQTNKQTHMLQFTSISNVPLLRLSYKGLNFAALDKLHQAWQLQVVRTVACHADRKQKVVKSLYLSGGSGNQSSGYKVRAFRNIQLSSYRQEAAIILRSILPLQTAWDWYHWLQGCRLTMKQSAWEYDKMVNWSINSQLSRHPKCSLPFS